jgi:hypothetical protein
MVVLLLLYRSTTVINLQLGVELLFLQEGDINKMKAVAIARDVVMNFMSLN